MNSKIIHSTVINANKNLETQQKLRKHKPKVIILYISKLYSDKKKSARNTSFFTCLI